MLNNGPCKTNVAQLDVVGGANIAFVVRARLGTHDTAFVVDTGFAGPPLLSLPFLCTESGTRKSASAHHSEGSSLAETKESKQHSALNRFISKNACVSYTAGCSVNLVGIGSSTNVTSDTILAPPILLLAADGSVVCGKTCAGLPMADVVSTTPMATTHILTLDWLRQLAPCCLMPSSQKIALAIPPQSMASLRPSFTSVTREMSGGAFVAHIKVGGVSMRATVDTGAVVFVAIGATAARKVQECSVHPPKKVNQAGVNGEQICSEVVSSTVEFAGVEVSVPVYMNDTDLGDVDAYIGAAFLVGFDLLVMGDELLARKSGQINTKLLDPSMKRGGCSGVAQCKA